MSYESDFDQFYRSAWRHAGAGSRGAVLLNEREYPYSIEIALPDGGAWLELGVGSGRVVDYHRADLERAGATCIGLDYSLAALRRCREILGTGIALVQGDVGRLPFEEGTFDLITLFGTLQSLEKKEWIPKAVDLLRYVKAGGRLGFSLHPPSVVEVARCLRTPSLFGNIVTKGFLQRELSKHEVRFSIERHHALTIYKKLASMVGLRLPRWHGFREFRRTGRAAFVTKVLTSCFLFPTFGHWWVWIQRKD